LIRGAIDRGVLIKFLRERGIREKLVEKVEMLREIRSRVGDGLERRFWTSREVRQGCLASPLLFHIVMVDLEEEMSEEKGRDKTRREENIFADDVVLEEEEM